MPFNSSSGNKAGYAYPIKGYQWAILGILLMGIAVLPFLRSANYSFINLDDPLFITENPLVTEMGEKGIGEAFKRGWGTPYFKPLVYLSWGLDHHLGDGDPRIFHLHNILLHGLNSLLVFFIAMFILKRKGVRKWFPAAVISFLWFAWHPLKVESVVWAMQRKDLLYSLFYLISVIAYLHARYYRRFFHAMISAFAFLLAMMSKSMAITLPVILVLLDLMLFERRPRQSLLYLLPVIIALLPGFLAYGVFENLSAYLQGRRAITGSDQQMAVFMTELNISKQEWFFGIGHRIALWLKHFFWPAGLSLVYPLPESFFEDGVSPLHVTLTIVLLLAALFLLYLAIRRRTLPLLIFLAFMVMLFPVLLQRGHDTTYVSDRFLYLPALLLIIPLAGLLVRFVKMPNSLIIGLLIAIVLGFLSWKQTGKWESSETLWDHSLDHYSNVPTAWNNRGMAYYEQGNFSKAGEYFENAIRYRSFDPEVYNNLGSVRARMGQYPEAIRSFRVAVELDSQYVSAWSNLGLALDDSGKPDEAITAFSKALSLDHGNVEILRKRAGAFLDAGKPEAAIRDYTEVLSERPEWYEALNGRAMAYVGAGETTKALDDLSTAIQLQPESSLARVNRAVLYARTGDHEHAADDFSRALELDNRLGNVWYMYAITLRNLSRYDESCLAARKAAELGNIRAKGTLEEFCP